MKRGWLVLIILLALSVSLVSSQYGNLTGCFGAELCGGERFPCGLSGDGVCPEDFFPQGEDFSCSSGAGGKCLDADCKACIYGRVKNYTDGNVSNAIIKLEVTTWDGTNTITLTEIVYSDENGKYAFVDINGKPNASSGHWAVIIADHPSYGADVAYIDKTHSFNSSLAPERGCYEVNFTFPEAYCESDCTLIGNDICFAGCNGTGPAGDPCVYYNAYTMNVCDNSLAKPGTRVRVAKDGETCTWVDCCRGGDSYEEPCPTVALTTTKIKDAIKVTRIVRHNNQIAKVNIYYWE